MRSDRPGTGHSLHRGADDSDRDNGPYVRKLRPLQARRHLTATGSGGYSWLASAEVAQW
jgi:hypothetical protein